MKSDKTISKLFIWGILTFILVTGNELHSKTENTALAFMDSASNESTQIQTAVWDYIKSSAHGSSSSQVDKKRKKVIKKLNSAVKTIHKIKFSKNDLKYKNAVLTYFNTLNIVFNQDYEKIVNMKEIAEQSYDIMEAYLLAQEIANEKLQEAVNKLKLEEKRYAKKNNINLIHSENEISKNLRKSGEVFKYHKKIYLIFFKSYKQELYLIQALASNDINKIEQNRLTLVKYSKEGLRKIKSIKAFKNDFSIKKSCEKILKFYYDEAYVKIPVMTDFIMKKEAFNKIKKAFDLKKKSEITKEDVEFFNKKVNELNKDVRKSNNVNSYLNKNRTSFLNQWNSSCNIYFDNHIPK